MWPNSRPGLSSSTWRWFAPSVAASPPDQLNSKREFKSWPIGIRKSCTRSSSLKKCRQPRRRSVPELDKRKKREENHPRADRGKAARRCRRVAVVRRRPCGDGQRLCERGFGAGDRAGFWPGSLGRGGQYAGRAAAGRSCSGSTTAMPDWRWPRPRRTISRPASCSGRLRATSGSLAAQIGARDADIGQAQAQLASASANLDKARIDLRSPQPSWRNRARCRARS